MIDSNINKIRCPPNEELVETYYEDAYFAEDEDVTLTKGLSYNILLIVER